MPPDTIEMSWQQVEKLVDNLYKQLSNMFIWNSKPYALAQEREDFLHYPTIIGISKGGLVPAAMLGYKFNMAKSKVGSDTHVFDPAHRDRINAWSSTHIVVDEIADKGNEQEKIQAAYREGFPNHTFIFATLITKTRCPISRRPDLQALLYPSDEWIIFPWAPNDTGVQDRCEEEQAGLLLGRDPDRGTGSGDAPVQDGVGEVREGQLEEGDPG